MGYLRKIIAWQSLIKENASDWLFAIWVSRIASLFLLKKLGLLAFPLQLVGGGVNGSLETRMIKILLLHHHRYSSACCCCRCCWRRPKMRVRSVAGLLVKQVCLSLHACLLTGTTTFLYRTLTKSRTEQKGIKYTICQNLTGPFPAGLNMRKMHALFHGLYWAYLFFCSLDCRHYSQLNSPEQVDSTNPIDYYVCISFGHAGKSIHSN